MADQPPAYVPSGYTVLTELGSGQTAHVFLAQHPSKGKVALKLPREELASQPVLRRMFENEVQITLGLSHPNVVAGLDGAPTGPRAFLVLEYCSRGTLGDLLVERKHVPLEQARQLIVDVARGLEHSHSRQVLHRDVKPANVFLTGDVSAKLGDFGTGMHIGDDSWERVGTAFYMAPEIFEGQQPTVQSDIYSLGILAYEVMAGVRPFQGDTYEDLMMAHMSSFPKALAHHREEVTRDETKVIGQAMARDASRRYRTVQEFRKAFMTAAGIAEPEAPQVEVTGRASRKPKAPPTDTKDAKQGKRGSGLFGWLKKKRED